MRFEVSYPTGVTHEVTPSGPKAVLGRDPGCDVVLNDTKCSRRHAVVEQIDGRLYVRDTTSANGIYVNGRRVDRAVLAPGDTVRMGDVQLRVLAELGSTLVAPPSAEEPGPEPPSDALPSPIRVVPPAGRPQSSPSLRRPSGEAGRSPAATRRAPAPPGALSAASRPAARRPPGDDLEPERPLTVSLLAGLWALFVPASVAAVLYGASRAGASPAGWALAAGLSAFLAGLGVAMALGLRALAPWAHRLQVAAAAVGLVLCPFTLASITVLLYMTRAEVKRTFSESGRRGGAGVGSSEPTFALSVVAMLGLGLAVTVIGLLAIGQGR
jgi:hypothetical protein